MLASFPHYIAGFLDQPAGPSYDNDDLAIWNILVLVGHGLMALTVLAFVGLLATLHPRRDGGTPSATTRGTPRRSSGPRPRRLPVTTSSTCRSSHSAEPLLDLKASNHAAHSATSDGSPA